MSDAVMMGRLFQLLYQAMVDGDWDAQATLNWAIAKIESMDD